MATRPAPKRKSEQSIKVRVVPTTQKISRPVVAPPEPVKAIKPPETKPEVKKSISPAPLVASEVQRRRVMWWAVGVGAFLILGGWLTTIKYEVEATGQKNTFFTDFVHAIRSFSLSGPEKKSAPQNPEIQKYEQQVFPQFSNTNS